MSVDRVAGRLRQLNAQREALEVEAMAISFELESPGVNGEPPAGVKSPLVDSDGYPRADVDVFNVRAKRNRLAIINTDHMALMKDIERELVNYHTIVGSSEPSCGGSVSRGGGGGSGSSSGSGSGSGSSGNSTTLGRSSASFASFDEVLEGSPADEAGICEGDELVSFGPVCFETVDALNSIPAFVGLHVNKPIDIQVRRGAPGLLLKLSLTPKSWGGRGLLGCHLKPKA